MSSQLELYPHNQIAYDKLCDMLAHSDRACVIQPTGTGKFVIIAKLVQDNPDKRFLLLGTNDYMFIDQMDNLEKIAPGFHPDNLQFRTYASAMSMARDEQISLKYDFIIVDEFHHCGAPEWSKGVQWVIDSSPDAKLVGFSATPIRFSDNGRDMADEIFKGNIASSMELEEAWLRGILPIPKYVIALYDAPKELGELKVSIEKVKDKKKYSKFTKKYEELLNRTRYRDAICPSCRNGGRPRSFVRNIETGCVYATYSDAARAVGIRKGSSIKRAIDMGGCCGGYHWEYVDD